MNEFSTGRSLHDSVGALDDYVSWQSGGTPWKANPKFWGGEIPWITPKDMKSFDLEGTTNYLTPAGVVAGSGLADSTATYVVVRGMILAHTFPVSQAASLAAFNQDVKAVLPGPHLLPRYLAYWFQGHAADFLRLVSDSTHGTKKLDLSDLRVFPMTLPSWEEQTKFVEIMTTVDDQITTLGLIVEKLERCRLGYVLDCLEGCDIQRVAPLGSLADVSAGVTLGSEPHGPGTVSRPYLRVANVQDGRLDLRDMKKVRVKRSDLRRFELQPGDVLMNEGGDADKLGRGAVWEGQILGCLHQNHVFRVRCSTGQLDPRYLSMVTGSAIGKRYFHAASKQTTNLATINSRQIKQFPVPLRAFERQLQIVDSVAAFTARITSERDKLVKLRLFKRGLMWDLLSSRVRVPGGLPS